MRKTMTILLAFVVVSSLTTIVQADPPKDRGPEARRPRDGDRERPGRRPPREGEGDRPRGDRPHGPPPIIAALDANRDGVISSEEIDNAPAALRKLDKNGDGKLTREELRPPMGPPRGDRPQLGDGPPRGDRPPRDGEGPPRRGGPDRPGPRRGGDG